MTQSAQDLGRRWFGQVWNERRRDAIAEMLAPDAVLHEAGVDSVGPEGFYPFFDRMIASFSDLRVTVEETFGENDRVCIRWSFTAKHTGPGLGIDPTGRIAHATGISIIRVAGNLIVEGWQNWDMLGMIEQIKCTARSPAYIG